MRLSRQQNAHFLLGFFAMPVCVLLGGMEALLFRWHGVKADACVGFFIVVPLAGSLLTRQRVLAFGLIAGLLATGCAYLGCSRVSGTAPRPAAIQH